MKGLYQVTAQKGKRILSSEVYGDSDDKDSLFSRLMNRHKIIHSQRPLFKLMDIKLNKDMTKSSFKFRDYQRTIISQGVGVLKTKRFLYLAMEVRTGKTLTSLGIADDIGAGNVLFLTKKKAISTIESDYAMLNPKYNLVVMNYESIHKLPQDMWDLIVCDEAHISCGSLWMLS